MISERYLRAFCRGDGKDIENYEKAISDNTQKWEIHHRLELTEDGEFAYSVKELKERGMYYDRPAKELIFLTPSEHLSLHHKGKKVSASTREKISKAKKGKKLSAEQRAAMKKPEKHFDILVSPTDDRKAYDRAIYLKKKALVTK